MTMKKRTFALILCLALIVGGGLMYGGMQIAIMANVGTVQVSVSEYENLKYMNDKYGKLEQLYITIEENFYKDVDADLLEIGMYKGLFSGLDDVY
jgi:predicted RND superfamily exporter protein